MIRRRTLGAGLLAALTSGCGFQPLYGRHDNGAVSDKLRQIDVALIPERSGQLLREELQRRLEGSSGLSDRAYLLSVTYAISEQGVATEFTTSAVTRMRITGTAHWTLTSVKGEPHDVLSGWAKSNDGTNLIDVQYFYTELRDEDVVRRISTSISQQIVTDLAAYFQKEQKPG